MRDELFLSSCGVNLSQTQQTSVSFSSDVELSLSTVTGGLVIPEGPGFGSDFFFLDCAS